MSSILFRLARLATRRPRQVLTAWLVALAVVGAAAAVFQQGTDDTIHIPGAQSTESLEHLRQVFPELAGSGVVVVVERTAPGSVDTPAVRSAVKAGVADLRTLAHVVYSADPFDPRTKNQVSPDGQLAVIVAFLDVDQLHVTPPIVASLHAVSQRLQARVGTTARVHLGGDALSTILPKTSPTEGLGLVAALLILTVALGSLAAAGLPMLMALLGAATTTAGIYLATGFTQIASGAPVLALMIGLAVGIDYALFVLARHRDQLREGSLDVAESVARATATAGSAVLVAGITVLIALVGMFVAGIPFLTTTGLAAAFGVAVAVAISLTALPAVMTLAGDRLRPRGRQAAHVDVRVVPSLARRWMGMVTAHPLPAVLLVGGGLALCAVPAVDLRLSLPDARSLEQGAPVRVTYELLTTHFGPGYNAPLLLMIDVLPSTDPVGVTQRIAREVAGLPGVAAVPVATPNRTGDTAIVEVLPTTAADAPATGRVVEQLHALAPQIRERYGLTATVTGLSAVSIDVSGRLAAALLPFALFVVGLSVLLLATVFRSAAVPLSAALGYLLSVGAAFGITTLVWVHGLFAGTLRVQHVGSVMAFVPIVLMGVLFGLAMDYQMFLVSRMREHYLRDGDARAAVVEGFVASARVVVAAALVMVGVFVFFVPDGGADTKPIAFSLAVGVLLDAFAVRMTLVPAVLTLLGERAWWLPAWADRRLPTIDAEGEALVHGLHAGGLELQAGRTTDDDPSVVAAHGLTVRDDTGSPLLDNVTFTISSGELVIVVGPAATALLLAVSGRVSALEGDLAVCGQVLPARHRAVRRTVVLVPRGAADPVSGTAAALDDLAPLLLLDGADRLTPEQREAVSDRLRRADGTTAVLFGCSSREAARAWRTSLPTARLLDLHAGTRVRPPGRDLVRYRETGHTFEPFPNITRLEEVSR